jgi:hypothetical protein
LVFYGLDSKRYSEQNKKFMIRISLRRLEGEFCDALG